jgi:hypothetical protein
MKIVAGALLRTTQRVHLREDASASSGILATLHQGVLAIAMGIPQEGWVETEVHGWIMAGNPNKVYSEPDAGSSVEATRSSANWQSVKLHGFVAAKHIVVEDGPQ